MPITVFNFYFINNANNSTTPKKRVVLEKTKQREKLAKHGCAVAKRPSWQIINSL